MTDEPWAVELSDRIYRSLIEVYPASFRTKYADEMAQVFHELATDALKRYGAVGLIMTWFRVLGDLARTALQEHMVEFQRICTMKSAALAIFSFMLAPIVYLFVFSLVAMTVGGPAIIMVGHNPVLEFAAIYIPALLTGMILTRVKPFYMPFVAAPLGTMAIWTVAALQDVGPPWFVQLGLAGSVGFVTLIGCLLETKALPPMGESTVQFPILVATMVILVCTSTVACVLWLVPVSNQLEPYMRPVLIASICALAIVASLTVSNLYLAAGRTPKKMESS
ncbi:MAG: hypothetical protein RIC85_03725 [Gammaproteobacteria bacterium]